MMPNPWSIAVAVMTMTDDVARARYVAQIAWESLENPKTVEQLEQLVATLSVTVATVANMVDTLRDLPNAAPLVEVWLRELGLKAASDD